MVGGTYEKAIFTQTSRSSTLHGNFGRHKLARWDGNRAGILELVPQVEWAQRAEWFTRDTLELLDRWEVDEIDGLLRLRQRVDMGKIWPVACPPWQPLTPGGGVA